MLGKGPISHIHVLDALVVAEYVTHYAGHHFATRHCQCECIDVLGNEKLEVGEVFLRCIGFLLVWYDEINLVCT